MKLLHYCIPACIPVASLLHPCLYPYCIIDASLLHPHCILTASPFHLCCSPTVSLLLPTASLLLPYCIPTCIPACIPLPPSPPSHVPPRTKPSPAAPARPPHPRGRTLGTRTPSVAPRSRSHRSPPPRGGARGPLIKGERRGARGAARGDGVRGGGLLLRGGGGGGGGQRDGVRLAGGLGGVLRAAARALRAGLRAGAGGQRAGAADGVARPPSQAALGRRLHRQPGAGRPGLRGHAAAVGRLHGAALPLALRRGALQAQQLPGAAQHVRLRLLPGRPQRRALPRSGRRRRSASAPPRWASPPRCCSWPCVTAAWGAPSAATCGPAEPKRRRGGGCCG